jgi:HD-GYP domain-containing protein (c-di-GMP phosphodiesterase class II)
MSEISLYSRLPKTVLSEGLCLPINIYVFLPQNESLIHYRKVSDVLTQKDLQFFDKVSPINLLIPRAESHVLAHLQAKSVSKQVATGDISAPKVKALAATALESMGQNESIAQSLESVGKFVQSLISQFKSTPSVSAYEEAMKRATASSSDPLSIHHQQVSSVAVLMALSIGDFSMDEISDLAAAGLIHDLGLKDVTTLLGDSHVQGTLKLTNQEKVIYMRHVDGSIERAKKDKFPLTPGVIRIVELHHENFDGSGFKNQAGIKTYRPARVLRIADDFVGLVQSNPSFKFHQALEKLNQQAGVFDPKLLSTLLAENRSTAA